MNKLKILIFFIILDVFLIIYYLNIGKNNHFYVYQNEIKPIVLLNKELNIYKDDDLNRYFNIYSFNEFNTDYKIDKDNLILTLNDNSYSFPFNYINNKEYYISIYLDNKLYTYKTDELINNNEIIINKDIDYKDFLLELIKRIDFNNEETHINLDDFNIKQEGEYIIYVSEDKEIKVIIK